MPLHQGLSVDALCICSPLHQQDGSKKANPKYLSLFKIHAGND
jgi:hypothetical protein